MHVIIIFVHVYSKRSEVTTPDSVIASQQRTLPTSSEEAKEYLQSLGIVPVPSVHASSTVIGWL